MTLNKIYNDMNLKIYPPSTVTRSARDAVICCDAAICDAVRNVTPHNSASDIVCTVNYILIYEAYRSMLLRREWWQFLTFII